MISKVAMAGAMTRLRLGWVTVAVVAAALLAALAGGCSRPADLLPAPDGPPAHPHCGTAPVLALGATQLQRAYGVPAMLAAGISGAGTTIADIVPYRNPWVARDLAVYSRRYGLPSARLQIIDYDRAPVAAPYGLAAQWARGGIGDLEMMHALAPDATLIYVAVPAGRTGPGPLYTQALSWVATHVRPDVVSCSSGTPEFTGLGQYRSGLQTAARAGVIVLAARSWAGGAGLSAVFSRPPGRTASAASSVITAVSLT
jgi:hypothetical protein